jgi:hypothetical protein
LATIVDAVCVGDVSRRVMKRSVSASVVEETKIGEIIAVPVRAYNRPNDLTKIVYSAEFRSRIPKSAMSPLHPGLLAKARGGVTDERRPCNSDFELLKCHSFSAESMVLWTWDQNRGTL